MSSVSYSSRQCVGYFPILDICLGSAARWVFVSSKHCHITDSLTEWLMIEEYHVACEAITDHLKQTYLSKDRCISDWLTFAHTQECVNMLNIQRLNRKTLSFNFDSSHLVTSTRSNSWTNIWTKQFRWLCNAHTGMWDVWVTSSHLQCISLCINARDRFTFHLHLTFVQTATSRYWALNVCCVHHPRIMYVTQIPTKQQQNQHTSVIFHTHKSKAYNIRHTDIFVCSIRTNPAFA